MYPLGHVPYGRERVAPVTPAGEPVVSPQPDDAGNESRAPDLATTRFGAIADAAAGRLWPRDTPGRRRATQESRVVDASRLLTVDRAADAVSTEVSRVIGIACLALRDVAALLGSTTDVVERAKQLKPLLDHAVGGARALEHVLALGARAGLWGTVHLWATAAASAVPFQMVFPGAGAPSG
jgi:hypothetical protein